MGKKVLKSIAKYIGVYISIIAIFLLLLFLTSLIPSESMKENVEKSCITFRLQTNRYMIKVRNMNMMFDNFTDSLMVNTAYSIDSNDPFYSAMVARKNYIPGVTRTIEKDTLGELKSSSKYPGIDQVGDLIDTVLGETDESFEYARYWHGYLVLLRPALIFFDLTTIRVILTVLLYGLATALFILIWKKVNIIPAILVLLGIFGIDYAYLGNSLQGSPVFLTMMISSIYILLRYNKIKNINILFFIIGAIACFVDFLTVPIITLGVPMIIYFLLKQKEENLTLKETLKSIIFICLNWVSGYALIWMSKWIIVDLLYNKGVFMIALQQFMFRSDSTIQFTYYDALKRIILIVDYHIIASIIIGLLIIAIRYKHFVFDFKKILPYLATLCMPLAWYFVLRQHSVLHAFFTYRAMLLLLMSIPLICWKLVDNPKNERIKKSEKQDT